VFTATDLVSPNVIVCGVAGTGCRRGRSCASMSAGTRFALRCTRWLTRAMNAAHAASRSAKQAYSSARLVSVGTMSAFASLTVFSTPPLDAGSRTSQVWTVTP
jgi:hypothetical protein